MKLLNRKKFQIKYLNSQLWAALSWWGLFFSYFCEKKKTVRFKRATVFNSSLLKILKTLKFRRILKNCVSRIRSVQTLGIRQDLREFRGIHLPTHFHESSEILCLHVCIGCRGRTTSRNISHCRSDSVHTLFDRFHSFTRTYIVEH